MKDYGNFLLPVDSLENEDPFGNRLGITDYTKVSDNK